MAKVLVIEDDPNLRGLICRVLATREHEAIEAVDGKEGIAAFGRTQFDLVICDMIMPVQDGFETIQQIRNLDASVPVVAISGAPGVDNSPC